MDLETESELLFRDRAAWSDQNLLTELRILPPMPDEDDELWNLDQTWYNAYIYLAQVNEAMKRKTEEAVPYFFAQASFGDPGEILRGVFKNGISNILDRNVDNCIRYAIEAYQSSRRGTRYWAVFYLGFHSENLLVRQVLERALIDPEDYIKQLAESALNR